MFRIIFFSKGPSTLELMGVEKNQITSHTLLNSFFRNLPYIVMKLISNHLLLHMSKFLKGLTALVTPTLN